LTQSGHRSTNKRDELAPPHMPRNARRLAASKAKSMLNVSSNSLTAGIARTMKT
jgi:hypothetical protein